MYFLMTRNTSGLYYGMLASVLILVSLFYLLFRKKEMQEKNKFLSILVIVNLAFFVAFKISLFTNEGYYFNFWAELPLDFTNINLIIYYVAIKKKSVTLKTYSFIIGTLSSFIVTAFYFAFYQQVSFNKLTSVLFYITEGLLIVIGILMPTLKVVKPHIKKMPKIIALSILLSFIMHIVNLTLNAINPAINANYYHTINTENISFLNKLYNFIPINYLYLIPIMVLLIVIGLAVLGLFELAYYFNEPKGLWIKEVEDRYDLINFITFPNRLYKGLPNYVPYLVSDELMNFDPKRNSAYDYCEARLFLCYRHHKIVGRVGGLINHAYNQKNEVRRMRFTRYDVIDDYEVTKLLLDTVVDWAKERGLTGLMGPIGFCDLDKQGMLVEGFDHLSIFTNTYTTPYHLEHLTKYGLNKEKDWVEYRITIPQEIPNDFERKVELIQRRYKFHQADFKSKKTLQPYLYPAFGVVNEAFKNLYGTVLLTERQIDMYVKQFINLIDLDLVSIVLDENDEVCAIGVLMPSLSLAMQKTNGFLFPFGWFPVIKALYGENDTMDMLFAGVLPKYQKFGVMALMMHKIWQSAIKKKIQFAETGSELEDNNKIQSVWKDFEKIQHKRRRCFYMDIK